MAICKQGAELSRRFPSLDSDLATARVVLVIGSVTDRRRDIIGILLVALLVAVSIIFIWEVIMLGLATMGT